MQKSPTLVSTYRLQVRSGVTFERLRALVDYFHELGISHLYLSPILSAESSSTHGYSVVDFTRIDPRVGTVKELEELAKALAERSMGLIVDFVPNHMSASPAENAWWRDVLELGPRSLYARFFDIDWNRPDPDLHGKVLAPVLTEPYSRALEEGLGLSLTPDGLWVEYRKQRFPLSPSTWSLALGPALDDPELAASVSRLERTMDAPPEPLPKAAWNEKERSKAEVLERLHSSSELRARAEESLAAISRSKDALADLLARQAFRLTHFRYAATRINYRRFFDIAGLVAVRTEDEEVFEETHRTLLGLMGRSWIQGLRIDHVDGLLDPKGYLERLPESLVLVEKILERDEELRPDWPVSGTTGYEAIDRIQRLFVDPDGMDELVALFEEVAEDRSAFEDVRHRAKLDAIDASFEADLKWIAEALHPLVARASAGGSVALDEVRAALRELAACFPVYRTYLRPGDASMEGRDRDLLARAAAEAERRHGSGIFDRLAAVLALDAPSDVTPEEAESRLWAALRFQQLTGPVMAKGVEDTAFYRYFPLLSLNEVGAGPGGVEGALEEFHEFNRHRAAKWPRSLTASSTHDTKRDEDVRARIHAISEVAGEWKEAVARWREWNRRHKRRLAELEAPDAAAEYHLYQTLVGTWPLESLETATHRAYVERLDGYMLKAMREAKTRTSWLTPEPGYEAALSDFIRKVLDPRVSLRFLDDFSRFESRIRRAGLLDALSQLVLKATMPGAPDFYQGTERWELRLVDPDNRRPVDFERLRALLADVRAEALRRGPEELVELGMRSLEDGRLKTFLTWRLLQIRGSKQSLFATGGYEPLAAEGPEANRVVAFARRDREDRVLVAVGRFFTRAGGGDGGGAWEGSFLRAPEDAGSSYREALTGRTVPIRRAADGTRLPLDEIFRAAPFAILEPAASAR